MLHGSVHSPAHPGKYPIPDERHIGVKVKVGTVLYDRIMRHLNGIDLRQKHLAKAQSDRHPSICGISYF